MKTVEFIKPCFVQGTCYNPGEIAGFDANVAAQLVTEGYAKEYKSK